MSNLNETDLTLLKSYHPCSEGIKWARTQESLAQAWEACERSDWMLWIIDRKCPLTQGLAVRLAIKFADKQLHEFEKAYPSDKRPREALNAAMAWVDNPCEETRNAAA